MMQGKRAAPCFYARPSAVAAKATIARHAGSDGYCAHYWQLQGGEEGT